MNKSLEKRLAEELNRISPRKERRDGIPFEVLHWQTVNPDAIPLINHPALTYHKIVQDGGTLYLYASEHVLYQDMKCPRCQSRNIHQRGYKKIRLLDRPFSGLKMVMVVNRVRLSCAESNCRHQYVWRSRFQQPHVKCTTRVFEMASQMYAAGQGITSISEFMHASPSTIDRILHPEKAIKMLEDRRRRLTGKA